MAGADWMPQFRFLMPALAPLYILLAALIAAVVGALPGTWLPPRMAVWGGLLPVLAGNGIGVYCEPEISKTLTKFAESPWTMEELKQQAPRGLFAGYTSIAADPR